MRKTIITALLGTTLATGAVLGGTVTAASAAPIAQAETAEEEGGDGDKSGLLGLLGLAGLAGLMKKKEHADSHGNR